MKRVIVNGNGYDTLDVDVVVRGKRFKYILDKGDVGTGVMVIGDDTVTYYSKGIEAIEKANDGDRILSIKINRQR